MKMFPLLSLMASVSLMAATSSGIPLDELKKMNFFKNKGVSIVGTTTVGDLTMASILAETPQGNQKISVFVTKDKKYVIVGGGYNDQTGEQIAVPMNMDIYKKDAGFVYGNGKKELYVFTDPECPYCMKMDKEVLAKLDVDEYKAHVFFYPLPFHRYAESASYYIISKEKDVERMKALSTLSEGFNDAAIKMISAYDVSGIRGQQQQARAEIEQIMGKKDLKPDDYIKVGSLKEKIASLEKEVVSKVGKPLYDKLAKQMEVSKALGVNGTPTLFDSKGSAVNWMGLVPKK